MAAIGLGTGGIGFRKDDDTALLLRLAEADDNVLPSDDAGNLNDMFLAPGLSLPAVASAKFGNGRDFVSGSKGLDGTENVADSLRLLRNVTVEAIVDFDTGKTTATIKTIVARGNEDTTAPEERLWSAKLVGGSSSAVGKLSADWRDDSGLNTVTTAAEYTWPTGFFYIAIVRRWISATSLAFDFYMQGELLETVTSTKGAISDGVGGTVTVGYADSASGPTEEWVDTIDQIRVSNTARTAEEIEHFYQEMFVLPGEAGELVRALLPPGKTYSTDLDSAVQREISVEADALAVASANAREMLVDLSPERASRFLSPWEDVTRQFPKPDDTVAQRRERVLGHLRSVHGFNLDQIKAALTGLLELSDADVAILENSNRFEDPFAGSALSGAWHAETPIGTIVVATSIATLALQVGDDSRWTQHTGPGVTARTSIVGDEAEIIGMLDNRIIGTAGDALGVYFYDATKSEAHVFGIRNDGGTEKWFSETIKPSGVVTTNYANAPADGDPIFIRLRHRGSGKADLQWAQPSPPTTAYFGPWTDVVLNIDTVQNDWAGLVLYGTSSSLGTGSSAGFEEVRIWMPKSTEVYKWFVYRNPALSGTGDIPGAQAVVNKIKPAHTTGYVTEATVAICDSATSLCDREPIG